MLLKYVFLEKYVWETCSGLLLTIFSEWPLHLIQAFNFVQSTFELCWIYKKKTSIQFIFLKKTSNAFLKLKINPRKLFVFAREKEISLFHGFFRLKDFFKKLSTSFALLLNWPCLVPLGREGLEPTSISSCLDVSGLGQGLSNFWISLILKIHNNIK